MPEQRGRPKNWDETDAFICACKGEPYTADEWRQRMNHLRGELEDAEARYAIALRDGVCMPGRFE